MTSKQEESKLSYIYREHYKLPTELFQLKFAPKKNEKNLQKGGIKFLATVFQQSIIDST